MVAEDRYMECKNNNFIRLIKKIYLKIRRLAEEAYNHNHYELSLKYLQTMSNYMYTYNLIYTDDRAEMLLKKIAEKNVKIKPYDIDKKSIVYYDFIGVDQKGLSYIYIKAFFQLGYKITYITENAKGSQYSGIRKMVRDSGGKVYIVKRGDEIRKAKQIAGVIQNSRPSHLFLYIAPWTVSAMLASIACENKCQRYMINLTDHAFWLGTKAVDYFIEFRSTGYAKSYKKRHISKQKLMILPFYPESFYEGGFKGFSFSTEGRRLIYSGGTAYKIEGSDKYLKMVSYILDNYDDTVFYYTGKGSNLENIHRWIDEKNYRSRFILGYEREDFEEVMQRCYFYLNTYPVAGGLMTQYAVKNGKIPVSLSDDPKHIQQLFLDDKTECEYISSDYQAIIEVIDKLLKDENELYQMEIDLKKKIITEQEFAEGLKDCMTMHTTKYCRNIDKTDYLNYTKTSLDRGMNNYELLIKTINKYIPNLVTEKFKLLYLKKLLSEGRKHAGN